MTIQGDGRAQDDVTRADPALSGTGADARSEVGDSAVAEPENRLGLLLPALLLAIPMVVAYAWLAWTAGGMLEWAVSRERLADGAYQLILLHMFAHAGLAHIVFNLMALLALGPAVMERLGAPSLRSAAAFFALFLGCGFGGFVLWLIVGSASGIPMLGASGAIFGLVGFIMRQPDPDAPPPPLFGRALGQAFATFVKLHLPLIAIFGALMLFGSGSFGLAWEAHLGGFLAGLMLFGPVLKMAGVSPDPPGPIG